MHHARADFSMVADTCRYILNQKLDFHDTIYYSLVVGIYTIYGRPFTANRGVGRLDDSIVPKEHRTLHDDLLKHRNQVYAHSDAVGAPSPFGNINQVRFFVQPHQILPGVTRWRAEPSVLTEIMALCQELKKKTKYWTDKIQDRHFPHLKVPNGEYLIDLDPKSSKFFTRVSPLNRVPKS